MTPACCSIGPTIRKRGRCHSHRNQFCGKSIAAGWTSACAGPACVFWLVRDIHDNALAQVRYDLHEIDSLEAVVSISVAREQRRRGIASRLLALSARRLFCGSGVRRIHAFARPENEPSCRALAAAGYAEMAATTLRGQPARHFVLARE